MTCLGLGRGLGLGLGRPLLGRKITTLTLTLVLTLTLALPLPLPLTPTPTPTPTPNQASEQTLESWKESSKQLKVPSAASVLTDVKSGLLSSYTRGFSMLGAVTLP